MTPTYSLKVNGNELPVPPLSITVVDNLGPESDALEVALPAVDGSGNIVAHPPHGRRIRAALGYAGQAPEEMGEFVVSAVTFQGSGTDAGVVTIHADTPELLGEGGAIKAPVQRSWFDVNLQDLFTTVVSKYNLEPHVSPSIRDVQVVQAFQDSESDLAFLTRLGKKHNATFKIDDNRALWIVQDSGTVRGQALARHDVALTGEGVLWTARYLDEPEFNSVTARWIDYTGGGGEAIKTETVGEGEPIYSMRHPYPTQAEAKLAAQAEYDEFRRGTRDLELTIPGRPEIRAGSLVELKTELPVADTWFVQTAEHSYDAAGLRTRLHGVRHRGD